MPIPEGKAASLYTGTLRHRRRPTTLRAIRYRAVPRRWAFWSMEPFSGPGTPDNQHVPQLGVCRCGLNLQQVAIVRFREQQTLFIEVLTGNRLQLIRPGKPGIMKELFMRECRFHAACECI